MRRLLVIAALWPFVVDADPGDEVRCAEIRFSLAVERRDTEAFRAAIDGDARFVANEVLRGPDAIVAAWAPFLAPDGPRIAWRPRVVEVLDSGELALTRGPYRLDTLDGDGNPVTRWGTFNSVWRRGPDGRWRVVFDAGAPPTESPSEETAALLSADTQACTEQSAASHVEPD